MAYVLKNLSLRVGVLISEETATSRHPGNSRSHCPHQAQHTGLAAVPSPAFPVTTNLQVHISLMILELTSPLQVTQVQLQANFFQVLY